MEQKKSGSGIAVGATVLIAANFIVKMIGVVYKIPLANILGSDGMGYLSSAYEIYQLLLTIFASGGAVAVSKIVAESLALARFSEVRKEFRIMLFTFITVGGTGAAVMFLGSGPFARTVSAEQAQLCMMVLAPAIFFLSVSCVFRGYYQGMQNMKPTGLTQITEAVFKLAIGIGFAWLLKDLGKGEDIVAAGAISGTTISTMIGLCVLLCVFFSKSNRRRLAELAEKGGEERKTKEILKQFVKLAIPLTMSSMVVNFTGVLDLFLIYQRLQDTGLDNAAANAAYGGYKGYAQTLFNLPPSIISSLNISIIPALSAAFVAHNVERIQSVVRRAFKLVSALAMPCAIGLIVLAGPIQRLLFPARLDEIAVVTPLLQILGLASYWTCMATLTTAALQSFGKMRMPVYSLIVGGAVKLSVNYILIGIPEIGMIGAPIGTVCCYLTIFLMNISCLKRQASFSMHLASAFGKPLFAGILMGAVAWGTHRGLDLFLPDALATIGAIAFAALVYGIIILRIRGIGEEDIRSLPKGTLLVRLLKLLHLLPAPKAQ